MPTSKLLRNCIEGALDTNAVTVTHSRAPADYLAQCVVVDQTGRISTTHNVLSSSPESGTLAVVDRTADIALAAKEIAWSCFAFGGKGVYVPGCVLVNEFVLDAFSDAATAEMDSTTRTERPEGALIHVLGRCVTLI